MNQQYNSDNQLTTSTILKAETFKSKRVIIGLIVLLITLVVAIFVYMSYLSKKRLDLDTLEQTNEAGTSQLQLLNSDSFDDNVAQIQDEGTESSQLPVITDDFASPEAKTATLTITSDKNSYQVGDQFEAILLIETSVIPDGVQFVAVYDNNLLSDVRLEQVNTFGSFVTAKVEPERGEIKAIFIRNPQEEPNLSSPLALLKITGVFGSSGTLSITFVNDKTQVAAAGGQDILQSVSGLTVTII